MHIIGPFGLNYDEVVLYSFASSLLENLQPFVPMHLCAYILLPCFASSLLEYMCCKQLINFNPNLFDVPKWNYWSGEDVRRGYLLY